MILRPALATLLVLLLLLLIKANIDTFRSAPPRQERESAARKEGGRKKISPPPITLNPPIRTDLPDLSSNYIFNVQRFLAEEERLGQTAQDSAHDIRPEDIVFNGALISEGYKKALVSYRLSSPSDRRTRQSGPQRQAARPSQTIRLTVGDELDGYIVTEITPDFILFEKGPETLKKTLFDPEKPRRDVTSRPTPPPALVPSGRGAPTPEKKP
ncbi:MAG: hypothetical protein RI601_02190 [Desulfurivibrionaceae bacterium]|nr:hypothetical protein [Desulfurivibrionaceae bacterium]